MTELKSTRSQPIQTRKRPVEILLLAWLNIGACGLFATMILLLPYFFAHTHRETVELLHKMHQALGSQMTEEELARRLLPKAIPVFDILEPNTLVTMVLGLIAAIGMLYAKNWARVLFVALVLLALLESFVLGVVQIQLGLVDIFVKIGWWAFMLLDLPLALVFLLILLSPRANAYFSAVER